MSEYQEWMRAVRKTGMALHIVPQSSRTPKLCEAAVRQDGQALVFVPSEMRTPELCDLAVRNDGRALFYVPPPLRTAALCEIAVRHNGRALEHVPTALVSFALCETAVRQDGQVLFYVPPDMRTPELCELAVRQDMENLAYVPEALQTPVRGQVLARDIGGDVLQAEGVRRGLLHDVHDSCGPPDTADLSEQIRKRVARIESEIAQLRTQLKGIDPVKIQLSPNVSIELGSLDDYDERVWVGRHGWGGTCVNYTAEGLILDVLPKDDPDAVHTASIPRDELEGDEQVQVQAPRAKDG